MTDAYVNAIATRVPPHEMHGRFDAFAARLVGERDRRILERTFRRSGIDTRWTVIEPADPSRSSAVLDREGAFVFGAFPSTGARMRLYDREAAPFAAATARQLNEPIHATTHLIVCSCTGMAAPGVDLQLVRALGLASGTQRTIIGFMGCYAAISALRLARSIVRSEPDARVLVVAVELCSLHMQETDDLERLLSFMLFADGCAAAVVSAEPRGLRLDGFVTALVPAADGLITWHVGDHGFDMVLSTRVPAALEAAMPEAIAAMVPEGPDAIDLWAVHPGGKAILDAVERALDLPPDALDVSRHVLRNYGNMSSASVMFVLAEMMRRGAAPDATGLAMAFGPGLTAEGMRFTLRP